jgi:uncharacterized membrane protein YqjE
MGAAPARAHEPQVPAPVAADIDNLPSMFGRLGDDVMAMLDAKLGLVKLELKEEASVYTRAFAFMAAGGLLAAVGFSFVNFAVAYALSTLFPQTWSEPARYALGFLLTGALYLVVGGVIILMMKGRLARHSPAPTRSLEELRKDKQWLKNEM